MRGLGSLFEKHEIADKFFNTGKPETELRLSL
jgi:hypothetical protein